MIELVTSFIETAGYAGIALLMFVETVFPPIPSEIILPFAGFSAAEGRLSLPLIVLASTTGSMLGTLLIYYIAHVLHEESILALIARRGKYIGITQKDFHKAQAWFDARGYLAVFLCRLIPGIRSLISIPAGIRRMKFQKFFIISLLGTTLWNLVLALGGYFLSSNYHLIESSVSWVSKGIYVACGLFIVAVVIYRLVIIPRKEKS